MKRLVTIIAIGTLVLLFLVSMWHVWGWFIRLHVGECA